MACNSTPHPPTCQGVRVPLQCECGPRQELAATGGDAKGVAQLDTDALQMLQIGGHLLQLRPGRLAALVCDVQLSEGLAVQHSLEGMRGGEVKLLQAGRKAVCVNEPGQIQPCEAGEGCQVHALRKGDSSSIGSTCRGQVTQQCLKASEDFIISAVLCGCMQVTLYQNPKTECYHMGRCEYVAHQRLQFHDIERLLS